MPCQRRPDNQGGNLDQVTQFNQIRGNAEMAVIILDLTTQQIDAMLRAL